MVWLFLLLSFTQDAAVEKFADYFFDSGLARAKKTALDDHLRLTLFKRLLEQNVDRTKLSIDGQADLELLTLLVDRAVELYRLYRPGANAPADEILPPRDYIKILAALAPGKSFELGQLPDKLSQAQLETFKQHLAAVLKSIGEAGDESRVALQALQNRLSSIEVAGDPPPNRKPSPMELCAWRIRFELYVDLTPRQLLDFAMDRYERTQHELEALPGKKTWRELVEDTKQKRFTVETLHDESAKLAYQARDYVIEKGLVSVPDSARHFEVRPADPRHITPFGHYEPATKRIAGAYMSPPISAKMSDEEIRQRLRDNNFYWTGIVALHEAVPGHHLQFERARKLKRSRLRNAFEPSPYVEGWGLYCEDMVGRNGYFADDPLWTVTLLRMRLWRCARVIIDIGLQTGTLTKDEATRLLVEGIRMEPLSAKYEVNHYASRPGYFSGYLLGYDALVSLRRDIEKAQGKQFDQKAFHDKFLELGPLPLKIVRRLMMSWAKPD